MTIGTFERPKLVDVPVTHGALRRLQCDWHARVNMTYHLDARRLEVTARAIGERWSVTAKPRTALLWARRFGSGLTVK
jgi:hypothetical protein